MRFGSEELTLLKQLSGSFDVPTQIFTPGSMEDWPTYGIVTLIESGIDGISVLRGDLKVYLPKIQLDLEGVAPVIGDYLQRGSTTLVILEVEMQPVPGYYRCHARVAK